MSTKRLLIAATAAALGLTAGVVWAESATKSDQPVTDSVITTKVKAELAKDRDTKARDIHVKTKDGVVTLSGSVDSMAEKDKAEQDTRGIKGVTEIANNLTVKQQ